MKTIISRILRFREQLILVFMLELLHFAIWTDFSGTVSRSLLLMHLGFFLIWQPLWKGEEKLRWYDIVVLLVITYAFVFWIDWRLLFAWVILLIGLVGGRVMVNQRERMVYMLTLVFLVFQILIRCTPMLFDVVITSNTNDLFMILLPILPLFILLLPIGKDEHRFQSVDFVHAISLSTLTSLLVAGTLLNMYRNETDYLSALILTLMMIGVFLLAISWLLIPRVGFSGLSQLWLRSMLNIGTPFEGWLTELSVLFRQKSSPEEFLYSTMEELIALPWIEGVAWGSPGTTNEIGRRAKHVTELKIDSLQVSIYSYTPVTGALYFHCKLLVQLINNFYVAKLRERELTQQTHLQAVYQTGARITHDIKNLLQSLQAITSVIVNDNDQDDYLVSRRLMQKQLPVLTQRLKLALEKLQTPETGEQEPIYLKDWWQDLKARITLKRVSFQAEVSGDPVIPADLFDSVVDNLLENIRNKVEPAEGLTVAITLYADEQNVVLAICDTGSCIPEDKAKVILKEPLQSHNGLGIGLYQAARQAEGLGYLITLSSNLDGKVCFELEKQDPSAQISLI